MKINKVNDVLVIMKKALTTLVVIILLVVNAFAQDARENFKYAKYYYDDKEYDRALEFIDFALRSDSTYINAYFLRAQIYVELGQYYSAVLDVNRILKTDKSETDFTGQCHLVRGRAYMEMEKYSRARYDFDIAKQFTRDHPDVFYYHAMLSLKLGEPDRSLEYLDRAIQKDPNAAYYMLKSEIKMEKYRDATESSEYRSILSDINAAIALNQDNYELYLIRSKYLNSLGNLDKAMDDYDKVIELSPDKDVAYSNRGLARLNKFDYKGALLDFNESIAINPSNAKAYQLRGLCYNNLNRYQEAHQDFTMSIDLMTRRLSGFTDKVAAKRELAETYLLRGHCQNTMGGEIQACRDFLRAYQLGVSQGLNYYRKFCSAY